MRPVVKRIIVWSVAGLVIAGAVLLALQPQPVLVDLAEAQQRQMLVTVDEEGETKVRDRYVVSAPVTGLLLRSDLRAGDPVVAGETVVARIQPHDPSLLDPRSLAEAQAALAAAEAARQLASAELEQTRANFEFALADLERARELADNSTISERELDEAELVFKTARAEVNTAQAALEVRHHELERARAHLLSPGESRQRRNSCECVDVKSPVTGNILQLHVESEGVVSIGSPLLEVGDALALEVQAELLSSDAVKVRPGLRTIIEGWGGEQPLGGTVRRIEPYGYTKVSALGIEEQRVRTLIDFTAPIDQILQLGHGYRVQVRVVLWESDATLTAPLTALFRDGDNWAVFVEANGLAELRRVQTGRDDGIYTQILEGLQPGERVVVNPAASVRNGVVIEARL